MLKAKKIIPATAALFLLCGCRGNKQTALSDVQTIPAAIGNISQTVTFVGNVTSAQTSELVWKTDGVIKEVFVGLGDTVTEGQVLATLSEDSLKASVIQAEPPLLQAKDDYEDLISSETAKAQAYKEMQDAAKVLADAEKRQESLLYPRDVSLNASYWKQQSDIAKQYYDEAKQRLDDILAYKFSTVKSEKDMYDQREEEMLTELNKYAEAYNNYLYYTGNSTENEKDQAAADLDVAKSNYEKALKNFKTFEDYPRPKDINAAQLTIDNAQKTYDTRSVLADIGGVVTAVNAFEGHYITNAQNAFRLDNMQHLYIPVDISEIDIINLKDGMKAQIRLDADPETIYQGEVTTIEASGTEDNSRVTFGTLIELKDPGDKIRLGMTAEVNIILAERSNVLLVPSNAIYTENGQSVVDLVRSDGTIESVSITTGIATETVTEVLSGLEEGQTVRVPSIDESILMSMGLSTANMTNDPPQPPAGMPPMGEPPAGFPGEGQPPQGMPPMEQPPVDGNAAY